jgi:hypothetical protein
MRTEEPGMPYTLRGRWIADEYEFEKVNAEEKCAAGVVRVCERPKCGEYCTADQW